MATHHVSLRRFCPNPFGQLTASRGSVSAQAPVQARRTLSKMCYCFYPWERLTTERSKQYWSWQGASVLQLYSHTGRQKRQCG
jgi:hypothetical protein